MTALQFAEAPPKRTRREKQKVAKSATKRAKRDKTINVRASNHVVHVIDKAAALLGQTRTDFVLESASKNAERVLLDQTLFPMGREQFDAFIDILDNPTPPTDKLRELMNTRAPWEK